LPTNGSGFLKMLLIAAPVFLMYLSAPGLTTSKMISSRVQAAFRPQVMNWTMKLPNTLATFTNALVGGNRSMISSD
jgi:hypothetical protein